MVAGFETMLNRLHHNLDCTDGAQQGSQYAPVLRVLGQSTVSRCEAADGFDLCYLDLLEGT